MTTNRWKLAAGSALLALCSYAAYGQADAPPPGPPPDGPQAGGEGHSHGPERELGNLTRALNLTADQQTGVKALLQQQATQLKALRAKFQGESADSSSPETRQARHTQVEQIRDETDTKISALLDDTQKPKFTQWVARRKAMEARRGSPGGNPPPPDGGGPPPSGV